YPPTRERLDRLEATIDALRRLWAGGAVSSPSLGLEAATVAPLPVPRPGPPVWIWGARARAGAPAAPCAGAWGTSVLAPRALAAAAARVDAALSAAGRPRAALRRSVELDAVVADTALDAAAAVEQFCADRGIGRDDPLLQATLAGDAETVGARVVEYRR